MPLPFGHGKGKGHALDLDCLTVNMEVTVVTCCGLVFQGKLRDDNHARSSYGCTSCFHQDPDDCTCDKGSHKPVEVDVKCNNKPDFICLELSCIVGHICCPPNGGTNGQALILPVRNDSNDTPLFDIGQTILISLDDITAIGPQRPCMAD